MSSLTAGASRASNIPPGQKRSHSHLNLYSHVQHTRDYECVGLMKPGEGVCLCSERFATPTTTRHQLLPSDLSLNSLLPFSVFGYTCAGASSFFISLSFSRRTVELRPFPGRKHRRLERELASWLYFLKRSRSVFLYHLPERLRVRMRKCLFASGEIQIRHSFLDL